MEHILQNHYKQRKLTTLVENSTSYTADMAELSVFETHKVAEKVALNFPFPIVACMLSGKKVMHLKDTPAFDFYLGESLVLPANETMVIDFPNATMANPTQCLALGIDPSIIEKTIQQFNANAQIEQENADWNLDVKASHLTNTPNVQFLIERLMQTFIGGHKFKDALLDLMIKELLIRLMQTKAKNTLLLSSQKGLTENRMSYIVTYIKKHLTENISIEKLANRACMSSSHFHKIFKNTLGESPIDFINMERIKFAKQLLKTTNDRISDVAYKSGFNNVSYFNRQFKKVENISPSAYKKELG